MVVVEVIVFTWVTWSYYVLVMGLKATRDRHRAKGVEVPLVFKVLAYPHLPLFLLMDVAFNFVVGSLIFLEIPKEWLFTARVSRWNDVEGFRGKVARWLCKELLDPADPDGRHCS